MIKIPYGISDFDKLRRDGAYYVDRTNYIEKLEASYTGDYVLFLRPRRFGKSLWISTLHHYYGIEYQADFQRLFGDLYIGQNPTQGANSYLVLRLNFSGIKRVEFERIETVFLELLRASMHDFFHAYTPTYFDPSDAEFIDGQEDASALLRHFFQIVRSKKSNRRVYVLIDEYDHFASALLVESKEAFLKTIGAGGFVRAFYESLKVGTESVIKRIFITGISPLMMDSLYSGFNIATDLSRSVLFHNMLGFKEEEVSALLKALGFEGHDFLKLLFQVRVWYNGYQFVEEDAPNRLYNPDMLLYFANEYLREKKFPKVLLDTNIASDYSKIESAAKLGGEKCIEVLERLVRKEDYTATLTLRFSLDRRFTSDDFVSLLYYMGLLTIKGTKRFRANFGMPNYVIETLYYAYFLELIRKRTQLSLGTNELDDAVVDMALDDNLKGFISLAEKVMQNLSNRDSLNFGEKHVQAILFTLLYPTNIYSVITEYEVGRRYIDVFLQRRDDSMDINQFILELKYLPKSKANQLEKVREAGIEQIQAYASHERFDSEPRLRAYLIVFVGAKAEVVEEVVFR